MFVKLAQGPGAKKLQSWDSNPGLADHLMLLSGSCLEPDLKPRRQGLLL